MADPRIKGTVSVNGVDFKFGFVVGPKGFASTSLPNIAPVRDPDGTQAEQSSGRFRIGLDQFEAIGDLVPATDELPSYQPAITVSALSIGEDGVLNFQLTATDVDDNVDANSWVQIGAVPGLVINADGSGTYTPPASFQSLNVGETAAVTFSVRVSDLTGVQSEIATLTITITGASDAPVIDAVGMITTDAVTPVTFDAFATDVEGDIDASTWRVGTAPAKGLVTIGANGVGNIFDPNGEFGSLAANDHEDVTFTLLVDDLAGSTASPVTVTARVTGTASAPTATNGAVSMTEDATIAQTVNLAALVIPGSAAIASYELLNVPATLTVTNFNAAAGTFDVKPVTSAFQSLKTGESSVLNISWRALDENGAHTNAANIVCTVNGVDDIPTVPDPAINLDVGSTGFVDPVVSDVDSAGLYASGPAFEWLSSAFRTDTGSTVDVGTVEFLNDTHQTVGGVPAGRIGADMTAALATLPFGQTITVQRNWRVRDAEGNWSVARKVRVFVTGTYQPPANGVPPTMTDFAMTTDAGVPVTEDLINHTADANGDFSYWTIVSQPLDGAGVQQGILTLESDGTYATGRLRYQPGNAYDNLLLGQSVNLNAQVSHFDAETRQSNIADVTITVNGLAQAPVAQNYAFSVNADQTFSGQLPAAIDANGNLNPNGYAPFFLGNAQTDGVLTVNADGSIGFDPNGVFDGLMMGSSATRVFQYTASDTTAPNPLVSSPATITVTINGVGMAAGPAPTYPMASMQALAAKYPHENAAMSRFMGVLAATTFHRTAVASGAWTDPAVWGGTAPQAGENVKIPYGFTVTFNEALTASPSGSKLYPFIFVEGTLILAPFMNVRLRNETMFVAYAGRVVSAPSVGIIHEYSVPSLGDISTAYDPVLLTRGIVCHGVMDIQGAAKDPYVLVDYWSGSGRKPKAGDTTLILAAAPAGWNVGDKVHIPATYQASRYLAEPTLQHEDRTITAIAGNVVTLDAPLTYDHDHLPSVTTPSVDYGDGSGTGGDRFELPVFNMSRNVRFVSEGGSGIAPHRRPHIMVMHRTNADGQKFHYAEIRDFGRTRKIQKAFTVGEMGANPILADTNLKGRYALHFHWVGVDPVDETYHGMASVIGCAIHGSPGWNYTVHRSIATLEDNVSVDAFAHYVWQSGDEPGWSKGNQASYGRPRRKDNNGATGIVQGSKRDIFVEEHDNGAHGQGFFFQGRLVRFTKSARGWSRVFGAYEGATWAHRGALESATRDRGPHSVNAANWDFGAAVGYKTGMNPDEPSLRQVEFFQITGCDRAVRIFKSGPSQLHDLRSFIRDFLVSEAVNGLEGEYTQHYTFARGAIVRGVGITETGIGLEIFNDTPDMAVIDVDIGGHPSGASGFTEAIKTTHAKVGVTSPSQEPVAGAWGYVFHRVRFGAQCGLLNNAADMPSYLESRTGQDGVTGPEDHAYEMTFLNPASGQVETFGPPPNPLDTNTLGTFGLVLATSTKTVPDTRPPTPAAQWAFSPGSYGYYGSVTDAYGTRESPQYYGPSSAFVNQNDSNDWNARARPNVLGLLSTRGYWQTPGGAYYVEDEIWAQGRRRNEILTAPYRLYIASNTPGIANNPPSSNFGNMTFTFNGVKA